MSLSVAFGLALSLASAQPAPASPLKVRSGEMTFAELPPVVGESCKTTTHISMRFESDDPAIIQAFGTERGGDKIVETTTLEVKRGLVTKLRVHVLASTKYGLDGEESVRTTTTDTIAGETFVLTRIDDDGHFAAEREDGSPVTSWEERLLNEELDQTQPNLLAGRRMKLGKKVVLDRRETARFFPFEKEIGVSMRGFEMTLAAIEGTIARVDGKLLFDLQGVNGDASVEGSSTTHTDADQRNVVSSVEGPLRIGLAGPANGIGGGVEEKVDAPHVVKGTFETTSQMACAPRR